MILTPTMILGLCSVCETAFSPFGDSYSIFANSSFIMDGKMYNPERRGLQFTDFEVPTSDDDSSVLLSNTNKLLTAVGISAKKISSTEELSRVASSMIVAVFESLFHQKIDGIVRNPKSIIHYERNAQLVIDSLSDQIQLDLQHITGKSIVSGDLRVLSNLVHILVRIVSLTRYLFLNFIFLRLQIIAILPRAFRRTAKNP